MTRLGGERGDEPFEITRAQLSRLLTFVEAAIVGLDTSGTITFAGPGLASLAGYDPEQVVGHSIIEFLHPDELDQALALLASWGARTSAAPVQNLRVRTASGDWVVMTVDAVTGADVAVFGGVVATLRRHDEHSELERQLRQRLVNEGRLVRLASAFVHLGTDQLEEGVAAALSEMGGLSGVDRVEIVMFDAGTGEAVNTHEWAAPGVRPLLSSAPRVSSPWRAPGRDDPASGGDEPSVGERPRARLGRRARSGSSAAGVGSSLAVPLADAGRVIGFIGFESVGREWTFEVGHLNTLRSAAAILAQAFARHAVDQELAFQARHDALTQLPNRWAFLELLSAGADQASPRPWRTPDPSPGRRAWRCSCSISTASRWSTTRSATAWATTCWSRWPIGCSTRCRSAHGWPAWAATSWWSCSRAWARSPGR